MARKITMNGHSAKAVAEAFEDFVISQTAQGLTEATLTNYRRHFHSISKHFDIEQIVIFEDMKKVPYLAIVKCYKNSQREIAGIFEAMKMGLDI